MGSRNSNSVNQKKRRGRKRKKALIIFAVIATVAGMLLVLHIRCLRLIQ